MFSIFYNKYKLWFWSLLSFLCISGGISNIFTGAAWEVALNLILGVVCLLVALFIYAKQRKEEE